MADYYVREEDGSSRFILEDASGDVLLESSPATPSMAPSFIASATVVNAPTLTPLGFAAPFIGSVTSVHAPTVAYTGNNLTFMTAGTFQWLCPPSVATIHVEGYGGGGGGCGGKSFSNGGGGGGGGGAYAARVAVPVTPGNLYTFVVGAAGAGSSPGNPSPQGGNGGDTTFTGDSGVQVVAKGGTGGLKAVNEPGGQASACTGDTGLKFSGGHGGLDGVTNDGGGGAASGNPLAAGADGADAPSGTFGAGGTGANGGGSGGHGGQASVNNAQAGAAPGGGGGGGGTNEVAGAGAPGKVTIVYGLIAMPFIASDTLVNTPTLAPHEEFAPFIPSVTVVYAPVISSTKVLVPFLSSNTRVYEPTAKVTFTGAGVSQVALEVLTSGGEPNAQVSQVTLEIIIPRRRGLFQAAAV